MKRYLFLAVLVLALVLAGLPALAADSGPAPGDSAVYFKGEPPFADQETIANQLAVAVLVKLGVIDGYPQADGTYQFDPDRVVTRAEMAKIISVIASGGQDVAAYQNIVAAEFADVPADYWARPYVAYCAAANIITGRGDGKFYPEAPVTNPEVLKMLLVALGYSPAAYGLVGNGWQDHTQALAKESGLIFPGGKADNSGRGCDRDNMALLVYQALFTKTAGGNQPWLAARLGAERLSEINVYISQLITEPEPEKVVQMKDLPTHIELTAFIDASSVHSTKGGYSCDVYDKDGNKLQRFIFEKAPEKSQVVVYKILSDGSISLFGKDKAKDYQPCPEPYQVTDASQGPERYTVQESGSSVTETLIVRAEAPIYQVADGELEELDELEEDDLFYIMRTDGGKLLAIFVVGKIK